MFRAGDLKINVCPSRLLAEAGWALELIDWWLMSTSWDGAGMPSGPPEWPFRGGMLRQPARLVQAVKILRAEWPQVRKAIQGRQPAEES